jgi:hypothetical protein
VWTSPPWRAPHVAPARRASEPDGAALRRFTRSRMTDHGAVKEAFIESAPTYLHWVLCAPPDRGAAPSWARPGDEVRSRDEAACAPDATRPFETSNAHRSTAQDAPLDDRRRMAFGACGELWVPSTDHAGVLKGRSRERECGSAWIGSGEHVLEVQDVLAEGVVPVRGGR